MKRLVPFLIVALFFLLVGFAIGWVQASSESATRLGRVVAMSWGDGKYGPYGAHVYLEPIASGYSVQARVYIGRGTNYCHDCGELGTVKTDSEAVAKWGTIDWREDGLHIGKDANQYFLPRAKMESHR